MSEFAIKVLRQAKNQTISKKTVDKLYSMNKLTTAEYNQICHEMHWEN